MVGKAEHLERQGSATLQELAAAVATAQRVIVWLAAVDVTLFRMPVPPLSPARLQTALPNLLEEQLLTNVSDCVFSSTSEKGPLRTLAVTQRAWLEALLQTLRQLGARHIRVLPEQLSLPYHADEVSAQISEQGQLLLLNLRLNEHEGMGLLLDHSTQLLPSLRGLIAELAITIYVNDEQYEHYCALFGGDNKIKVLPLTRMPIALHEVSLNLAADILAAQHSTWDWRPWRWPLLLGTALLLTQTVAINLDWWHLSREARDLRTSMTQIYLSAYPKETVILDPLLQMQQKIATTRREVGLSSPDDFNSLVAELGAAWSSTPAPTSITAIEYHDHKLNVTLKDKVSSVAIQTALAQHGVTLETSPDTDRTWIIGSKK